MDTMNIYCDESCHLENDGHTAMTLGALVCPRKLAKEINAQIIELKNRHGLSRYCETKFHNISNAKLDYYVALIDLFFDTPELRFRGWVIPDKKILDHEMFSQDHDDFYYKMYFYMLNLLISNDYKFHIYLDIKDTRSQGKVVQLEDVLANANYDFNRQYIEKIQNVHSHDIALLQLTDLLLGALSYAARGLESSRAKIALLEAIREKSSLTLENSTAMGEQKFNICYWKPKLGGIHDCNS